ncbi:MAG: hypothetical protein R3290_12555, partial [Acidimicrobiia bacterium]|nr:hypothetical protein [Acidimicrobiia bacterium]
QQALIAMHRTTVLALVWTLGLAAAAVVVGVTDGTETIRVARAFLLGEAIAFAGLVTAVLLTAPAERPADT